MEAMGLKDAAKKLMDEAGVPITPGYHGKDQSPKLLKAKAGMIGYPVLIKAVAGGGGKGMRKVEADADFDAALASCQREAASSFGNDDVLIEKYIQSPRHIEVQVFGDTHGNVMHMFERDCSLQRRHQKVIEEAPAPGMTDAVRKAMTDAAIAAAKAVNYVGAGTVEFIVDGSGKLRTDGFWFMEMNTRLQVEHPVTEEITGLDLVEWQIRVARGEELPPQKDIKMKGHSIEARIYAEDPANDFLPSIGRIRCFDAESWTEHDDVYRIDSGVEQDDKVSVHYDPMIAKLIALAEDRTDAIENLIELIDKSEICGDSLGGLKTNSDFVRKCLSHPQFLNEELNTHFIEKYSTALVSNTNILRNEFYGLAALYLEQLGRRAETTPFSTQNGWRMNQAKSETHIFSNNEKLVKVTIGEKTGQSAAVTIDDSQTYIFEYGSEDYNLSNEEVLNHYSSWAFKRLDDHISITRQSEFYMVPLPSHDATASASSDAITAPMPGKIIALNCAVGDSVSEGDALVVMEAMKMEQTLTAPRDGIVAEIGADVGELVTDGALLVRLEEEENK